LEQCGSAVQSALCHTGIGAMTVARAGEALQKAPPVCGRQQSRIEQTLALSILPAVRRAAGCAAKIVVTAVLRFRARRSDELPAGFRCGRSEAPICERHGRGPYDTL
jgi:hypothetical protein